METLDKKKKEEKKKIFTLDGCVVEIVKEFKQLGVLFTQNGRFIQNVKKLSQLACKAMYLLKIPANRSMCVCGGGGGGAYCF